MPKRRRWFWTIRPDKYSVLSLSALAEAVPQRPRQQFEVLVRHLFHRFLHNELVTSDDESKRLMQIAHVVALPGLLAALLLFPAYHAFPGFPPHRAVWDQIGDHYFYVMYSFIAMGGAMIFEWDLLFPDLLDVFVLAILPLSNRRLLLARVTALVVFLGLVLFGTGILGAIFFPAVAAEHNLVRMLFAHAVAISASGIFAAAAFLALQGILLNMLGERIVRHITPIVQSAAVILLLTVLLLCPALSNSLHALLGNGGPVVRAFPPFWFLGVYERLLAGPAALPIFKSLARTGTFALLLTIAVALITYPLAYHRRVRQLTEGGTANPTPRAASSLWSKLLHATLLRVPAHRATFHFIAQTAVRAQQQRVTLAMYGGLGVSLMLANLLSFHAAHAHLSVTLSPSGIRAAVPIIAFWTTAGLAAILATPIDRRGAWLFRVSIGRARLDHLTGVRVAVTLWATITSVATAIGLHWFSPPAMRSPVTLACQILAAASLSLLLADVFLYSARTIPFTWQRPSAITDFPYAFIRYVFLYRLFVMLGVYYGTVIETGARPLIRFVVFVAVVHLAMRILLSRSLGETTIDMPPTADDGVMQRLGLRES